MATFYQYGRSIDYTNPSSATAIEAGDIVQIGDDFYGVASHPIPVLQQGTLTVAGVFQVPAADTISAGAPVYAGSANTAVGSVESGVTGTQMGRALNAVTSGGICLVLLNK